MKKQFLTFLCVAASLLCIAQTTFQKNLVNTLGDNLTIRSVTATSDNGMLAAGLIFNSGWSDGRPYFAKMDLNGQLQWAGQINPVASTSSFDVHSVIESQSGGYTALLQNQTTSNEIGIIHLDSNGNTDWSKVYFLGLNNPSNYGRHVMKQAPNGDYIINLSTYVNLCVLRTDSTGNLLWAKTFVGDSAGGKCPGFDCEFTAGGDVMLTGKRNNDRMLVKIDAGGQVLWTKILQSNDYTHLKKIKELPGGDFLCAGLVDGASNSFYYSGLLLRMDANGNTIWRKVFDHSPAISGDFIFYDLEVMNNGEILLAGLDRLVPAFIHTDSAGNVLESKYIGGSLGYVSYEMPQIAIAPDGQLVYSSDGEILLNSYQQQMVPAFKLNPILGSETPCIFENNPVTVTPDPEPVSLTISTGMTESNLSPTLSAVTFTAAAYPLQVTNFCQPFGINETGGENSFSIFPNPVNENESITLSFAKNFSGTIQLFDMKGSLATQQAVNGSATVQVETGKLQKGIYLVRATNERNEVSTSKIVIE